MTDEKFNLLAPHQAIERKPVEKNDHRPVPEVVMVHRHFDPCTDISVTRSLTLPV